MADATLSGALNELGPRATLVGLLPAGTLAALIAGLLAAGAPGRAPDPALLFKRASDLTLSEGGVVLVGLVVATVLTQPLQLPLVQLLEGYWLPGPPGRWGRAWQRRRRDRLDSGRRIAAIPGRKPSRTEVQAAYEAAWRLARRYPPADVLLPTALGNTMRAAEYRASAPYGFDTVTAWPRLYPVLSETVRSICDDRRLQLDVAARFSATFVVAAVFSAALLWQHGWWLTVAAGCLALAAVAYRAAVAAAVAYGESIAAAFDLHHLDLLAALHLPAPANTAEERKTVAAVWQLLARVDLGATVDYNSRSSSFTGSNSPNPPAQQGIHRAMTPEDVHNAAFSKSPSGEQGYDEGEVDAFLDLIEERLRDPTANTLTAEDIHNAAFSRPPSGEQGYDEGEVDAFLARVEKELSGRARGH